MISRRAALKLGAAGLTAPALGRSVAPVLAQKSAAIQVEKSMALLSDNIGPRLDLPIAIKWKVPDVAWSGDGNSLNDDTILTASSNRISSIDLKTGVERWTFSIPEDDNYAYVMCPKIVRESAFFVSHHGEDRFLYHFDLTSGQEKWRFRLHEAYWPVFYNAIVFILGSETGLIGLDIESGDAAWIATEPVQAIPIFAQGNRLFAWAAGSYCVIDLDSKAMLWGPEVLNIETSIESAPYPTQVDGDLYFPVEDSTIHSIDGNNGILKWSFQAPDRFYPMATIEDSLIGLCFDGNAYCLSKETGDVIWRWGSGDQSWSLGGTDAAINPYIAIDELFYPHTEDGLLVAIDRATGIERWRQQKSYFTHRPVLGGEALYTFEYQTISCLDSLTGKLLWKHEFDELEYDWEGDGHPIVHGGNIYLSGHPSVAIGNITPPTLIDNTDLKAAPFSGSAVRRGAHEGEKLDNVGAHEMQEGVKWVEVTIGEDKGWIPVDAIDPATLPPEGGWEIIYQP